MSVIPEFINTPMDILALGLFDLMAPLALKVAIVDGCVDVSEKLYISRYLVKEWGYNEKFVTDAISLTENNLTSFNIKDLAYSIAEFQKVNPDCNYEEMSSEIISFLKGVMESDGRIDEREEFAIEKLRVFLKKQESLIY